MPYSDSYVGILKDRLKSIEDRMVVILSAGSIERYSKPQSPWLALSDKGMPPPKISYRWTDLGPNLERDLNRLMRDYQVWGKAFDLLFSDESETKKREIKKTHMAMYLWLKTRTGHGNPSSIQQAVGEFREAAKRLYFWLDELEQEANDRVLLAPDTNALIDCPNLESYADLIDGKSFQVKIAPTVLSELDDLKRVKSDKKLRQKARDVIKMLNNLREHGDILSGIELTDQVSVCMIPTEPQFDSLPNWLDSSNNDDRILATVLEIQRANPANRVFIVSNDLNMQNKASFASVPVVERKECWEDSA